MKKFAAFLILVLFGCLPTPARAHPPGSVVWLRGEMPPVHILRGERAGQGIGDRLIKTLEEKLPEYTHLETEANIKRSLKLFREKEPVVSLVMLKTPEREEYMLFGAPTLLAPPIGLAVASETPVPTDESGKASLAEIMADPGFVVGVTQWRSFGDPLDKILAAHKKAQQCYTYRGIGLEGLFRMLAAGRVQGVLCYPPEVIWVTREAGLSGQVRFVPLTESRNFQVARVAVPKTPFGREILPKINRILREEAAKPSYRTELESFTSPALLPEFREAFAKTFETPAGDGETQGQPETAP